MKVDFNPNYNQSFGKLYRPSKVFIDKTLGWYLSDEFFKALPKIKEMAKDVDIYINCYKGPGGVGQFPAPPDLVEFGFSYVITKKLDLIENPIKRLDKIKNRIKKFAALNLNRKKMSGITTMLYDYIPQYALEPNKEDIFADAMIKDIARKKDYFVDKYR